LRRATTIAAGSVCVAVVATTWLACGISAVGALPAADAGPDVATAPPDANVAIDAGPPVTCDSPGLQAGAPWPMIGGCVMHQGRTVFRGPHKQPKKIWEHTLGRSYKPVPVIGSDDRIIVGADVEGVRIFLPDGGELPKIDTGGRNVSCAPAIGADGTVYFGADKYATWSFGDGGKRDYDMGDQVDSSPVLDAQGNSYFASNSHRVMSFAPSGTMRWQYDALDIVNSSIAIGPTGALYFGVRGQNRLIALRAADGGEIWRFDTGGDTQSSPVIANDGTIYIGTMNSNFHAVGPDGKVKWTFSVEGNIEIQMLPAIATDGTVYVAHGTKVSAFSPVGARLWMYEMGANVRTSVVVDADGVLYVAGGSDRAVAIGPDGKELWRVSVGDESWGLAIGRDGSIYYATDNDAKIYAFHE
jgi:outer membrane protein assembly factor BamB